MAWDDVHLGRFRPAEARGTWWKVLLAFAVGLAIGWGWGSGRLDALWSGPPAASPPPEDAPSAASKPPDPKDPILVALHRDPTVRQCFRSHAPRGEAAQQTEVRFALTLDAAGELVSGSVVVAGHPKLQACLFDAVPGVAFPAPGRRRTFGISTPLAAWP